MHGHVALIEMEHDLLALRLGHKRLGRRRRLHRLVGDKQINARPLRLVVLPRYAEHVRADYIGYVAQNFSKTLGVILFVYIGDIILLFPLGLSVANIVYIKAERFRQVIKRIKLEFTIRLFQSRLSPFTPLYKSRRAPLGRVSQTSLIILYALCNFNIKMRMDNIKQKIAAFYFIVNYFVLQNL